MLYRLTYKLLAILIPLLIASCSSNDDLRTKDVTFELAIPCTQLTLTDHCGDDILNSVTIHDIDSVAYIDFKSMPFGNHTLELSVDGKTSTASFPVTEATTRAYTITINTSFGIHINDEWKGMIPLGF